MKICCKCRIGKDENEFYKDESRKDGLRYKCIECIKQDYKINLKIKENQRIYEEKPENRERKRQYDRSLIAREKRSWRNAKPENKEKRSQKKKEKKQNDICYKLRENTSCAIRSGLKNNGGSKRGFSVLEKLPYTMQKLKQHIESLWEPWMNWENWGLANVNRQTWQIDHINPHSSFHYINIDCEEFRKCWDLSNLRPLEAMENIRKGNKIKGVNNV